MYATGGLEHDYTGSMRGSQTVVHGLCNGGRRTDPHPDTSPAFRSDKKRYPRVPNTERTVRIFPFLNPHTDTKTT